MGERVLCKHEVVGSIPSGSTKAAVGERAAAAPLILPVRFICLVLARKRRAVKKAEWPAMRMSISSVPVLLSVFGSLTL